MFLVLITDQSVLYTEGRDREIVTPEDIRIILQGFVEGDMSDLIYGVLRERKPPFFYLFDVKYSVPRTCFYSVFCTEHEENNSIHGSRRI